MNRKIYVLFLIKFLCSVVVSGQVISFEITSTCTGFSDGQIELNVDLNDPQAPLPPFSFLWTDLNGNFLEPVEEDANLGYSRLEELPTGEYCVSVVSLIDGCRAEIAFACCKDRQFFASAALSL